MQNHRREQARIVELISTLAHEVNQPLGTIANYAGTCAELIAQNRLNMQDLQHCLEKINEQCVRAGEIIRDFKTSVSNAGGFDSNRS